MKAQSDSVLSEIRGGLAIGKTGSFPSGAFNFGLTSGIFNFFYLTAPCLGNYSNSPGPARGHFLARPIVWTQKLS